MRRVISVFLPRWQMDARRHRLRRNPLDDAGNSVRVDRAIQHVFAAS